MEFRSRHRQNLNNSIVAQRRFPPPWSIEERQESFIVKDSNGLRIAYLYFEDEPQRQMSMKRLSRDEAFLIGREHRQAAERATADIEGHPPAAEYGQPGGLSAQSANPRVGSGAFGYEL